MKKLFIAILSLALCLSCGTVLIGCKTEPQHNFATEWSSDDTHHWHACTDDDCTEIKDKASHVNTVVLTATEEKATCSVCGKIVTSAVDNTIASDEEWTAAVKLESDNAVFTQLITMNYMNQTIEYMSGVFQVNGDVLFQDITTMDSPTTSERSIAYAVKEGENYFAYNKVGEEYARQPIAQTYYEKEKNTMDMSAFKKSSFTYDEDSKSFKASSITIVEEPYTSTYTNVEFTFANKKLVKISYDQEMGGGMPGHLTAEITYGNATAEKPATFVDGCAISAEELASAIVLGDTVLLQQTQKNSENEFISSRSYVVKDGKIEYREVSTVPPHAGTFTTYYSKDGTNYYKYHSNNSYAPVACSQSDYEKYKTYISTYFTLGNITFDKLTYNEGTGIYTIEDFTVDGLLCTDASAKFRNGLITEFKFTSLNTNIVFTVEYENVYDVNIPNQ
ncbi:MAG: hypothetical protein IKC83_02160 [Clostridia bacterium]|nr:hypothetical protein [Clostridia bacterium]